MAQQISNLGQQYHGMFTWWMPQPTIFITDWALAKQAAASWLQPYRLTTLQPYNLTTLQPYKLTTLQPYNKLTTLQSFNITDLQTYKITDLQGSSHPGQKNCLLFNIYWER